MRVKIEERKKRRIEETRKENNAEKRNESEMLKHYKYDQKEP
jgi:hypothetical protein